MNTLTRKKLYILIVIIMPHYLFASKMLFMGTIQFPHMLESIPDVRIYCAGNKIKCENQQESRRISFGIADERHRSVFHLLITNKINVESEENTVKYLKSPTSYKLYRLQLTQKEGFGEDPQYCWDIRELQLGKNKRLPDDTIIVFYNPAYVDKLKGGNAIELPTIHIKSNILDLVGSEKKLHEVSNEMLLASLDYEPIHARIKQELQTNYQQKTILAVTV